MPTNKHLYIYSPSGAVRDKAAFKRGVARLKSLGFDVEVDTDALRSFQRFAGDDATRVAAIHRACASGAAVALISRGGYGLTRILPQLPYAALQKSIEQGTQFVGMSDFTALQTALLAQAPAISWAGPALCEGFGVGPAPDAPDDIMEDCFMDMVRQEGEATGWRQHREPADGIAPADTELTNATLWGGNLAVLCSLLGTPYFPKISRGILFVEDVSEHPYRIERMLTQLLHAGVLTKQRAIVLGQFTSYQLTAHDKGFKLATVVNWLRKQVDVPILTNLPYGHVQTKVLLPVGARCDLVVQGRDVLLAWGHVH
jgi:muramoyltetrapeptide carboxypeptidase